MSDSKNKAATPTDGAVPKAVVNRLSLYLRELERLVRDGHATTSSTQLGRVLGFTDAQVRKDLAYFGHFGYPGIGYRCDELIVAIRRILGTDQTWTVALVGAGNLGTGLAWLSRLPAARVSLRGRLRYRSRQGRQPDRRRSPFSTSIACRR